MKVLHVLDHSIPLHSGYTFRTKAILEQQRGFGITTVHVTSAKQGEFSTSPETVDELVFYRSDVPSGVFSKLPLLGQWSIISSLKKALVKVIETEKPDIIHAHSPALNGVAANWAAKKFGIPFVYEIRAFWEDAAVDHGTCKEGDLRYRLTRGMESNVVKNADAVTVICQGLKDDLISRGVAQSKITLIPNAVELDKFIHRQADESAKQALRGKLNMGDAYVLGFIGSFYAYEGLDILIRAMKALANADKPYSLLLVGGGPEDAKLKALAKQLQVDDKITFTGRVPHAEVANYYDLVDLLVFPRKSMRLTELVTPLKPLEAMAQKKLVLASDVGGHKELIDDGHNAFLFAADDEQELADKIIAISAREHAEVLENGLNFVKEVRNWKVSVGNYLPVYEGLLKKP